MKPSQDILPEFSLERNPGYEARECPVVSRLLYRHGEWVFWVFILMCLFAENNSSHVFQCLYSHKFKPGPPEDFHYTNQGDCVVISDVDDESEFSTTREALRLLGFHDDHQQHMFRVLASILHLGNIEISSGSDDREEESVIDPEDPHLLTAASLLGMEVDQLQKWLCNRRIATAQEVYTKPLTPTQV